MQKSNLGTEKIKTVFIRLVIPSVIAQLVSLIYIMVDRIYIGHIADVGSLALTGVGVCTPLVLMITGFANLAGAGGGPRASIALGKGDREEAERILGNCFLFAILLSAVLTVVFRVFSRQLLVLFGASDHTLPYAMAYMNTYILGTVFVVLTLSMNFFITAQGFTKISMLSISLGAICNIVLDPVFIFGLDMGIRGAALATVLSQALSMIWILCFLFGKKPEVRIRRQRIRLEWRILTPCLALGLSPFVMQITECALSICFNNSLLKYGGDIAVGAMSIFTTVMQIASLPMQGICQGAQPITGYNYGAGRWDRVRENFFLLVRTGVIFESAVWILILICPRIFIGIFTNDPELTAYCVRMIRIYFATQFVLSLQNTCQNTFLALGNAKTSLLLALERKVFLLIPMIYILPLIWKSNQEAAVFLAEPISDCIAAATTVTMFLLQYRKKLFVPKGQQEEKRRKL